MLESKLDKEVEIWKSKYQDLKDHPKTRTIEKVVIKGECSNCNMEEYERKKQEAEKLIETTKADYKNKLNNLQAEYDRNCATYKAQAQAYVDKQEKFTANCFVLALISTLIYVLGEKVVLDDFAQILAVIVMAFQSAISNEHILAQIFAIIVCSVIFTAIIWLCVALYKLYKKTMWDSISLWFAYIVGVLLVYYAGTIREVVPINLYVLYIIALGLFAGVRTFLQNR